MCRENTVPKIGTPSRMGSPHACGENLLLHFHHRPNQSERKSQNVKNNNQCHHEIAPSNMIQFVNAYVWKIQARDHPRVCRETTWNSGGTVLVGITPACVGKFHNFFHASSLSHYLSQISDSIITSVFSITKYSQKISRLNRRNSSNTVNL